MAVCEFLMLLTVSKYWPNYLPQVALHAVRETLSTIAEFAFSLYLYYASIVVNVLCFSQFAGVLKENKLLQEK